MTKPIFVVGDDEPVLKIAQRSSAMDHHLWDGQKGPHQRRFLWVVAQAVPEMASPKSRECTLLEVVVWRMGTEITTETWQRLL